METTYSASAGDIVSFYWKVSSESSSDYLRFEIDGTPQNSISGTNGDWQKKSYALSAGSRTLKWVYEKDSSGYDGDDCGWVDGLYVGPSSGSLPADPEGPGAYAESVDSSLKFTSSGDSTWYNVAGSTWDYHCDGDSAQSYDTLSDGQESCLQAIVESGGTETVKFWWKVSSRANYDYLQFYIDTTLKDQISGEVDWQQKSYSVSSGIHTLKWRYIKDGNDVSGDNCGWVDFVQWTGDSPARDPNNWQQLEFKHDVVGRRVEKKADGYSTRYCYDGPHVIAEYDGNNNLLRKYIYGPGIDQPVSMIEVADGNAAYYYHYDALGSVIALSDSTGDTVQTYEYSTFGEPAVEDPNHTNPYMFAGRRYDIEIGLYYNRARYYNPYTGRFLQTDPIGYGDGMNMYAYCGNNSLNFVDPSGKSLIVVGEALTVVALFDPCDSCNLDINISWDPNAGSGSEGTRTPMNQSLWEELLETIEVKAGIKFGAEFKINLEPAKGVLGASMGGYPFKYEGGEWRTDQEYSAGASIEYGNWSAGPSASVILPIRDGQPIYDESEITGTYLGIQNNPSGAAGDLGSIGIEGTVGLGSAGIGVNVDEAAEFVDLAKDRATSAFSRFWNQLEQYLTDPMSPFWHGP